KDNEPLANIHLQAIGYGFLTFVNACQEYDDNSLKLFASLLISRSYSSAYADLAGRVNINEYNNNYLTAQFEELHILFPRFNPE
ncbi:MAG: YjbM protein, partial [Escherichia coli DORA_A_5_14_21]